MLSQQHLLQCCGLTLHEYALRHGLPLDLIVPRELINQVDPLRLYPQAESPDKRAMLVLTALQLAGVLQRDPPYCYMLGEIRKLDQLLWLQQQLKAFGFIFRQQFTFNDTSHRVLASNMMKALDKNIPSHCALQLEQCTKVEWCWIIAVMLAVRADFYGAYLFLHLPRTNKDATTIATTLQQALTHHFAVATVLLEQGDTILLRTRTANDAPQLLESIASMAQSIPNMTECYYSEQPQALVAKQVTFDAAHFITDHPGPCANLHGGRYDLIVKIKDRVHPHNGFVVDYGVLKRVIQTEIIQALDHKNLNLCDTSLAWRSSSEYIAMFIWQRLIAYFPNLVELQLYETANSYCVFRGPSLDVLNANGGQIIPAYFQQSTLGQSDMRKHLCESWQGALHIESPQYETAQTDLETAVEENSDHISHKQA